MNSTTGNTTIGERTYSGFQGYASKAISDVAIWNTVLSSGQISTLAAGVRPGYVQVANLVGWWQLNGALSPEPDYSGNGNNGTLTGTAAGEGEVRDACIGV